MKHIYPLLFILYSLLLQAQGVKGVVQDAQQNPISGAFVYLDGTTMSTYTLSDGTFEIKTKNPIYSTLVISYMGHETASIKNPFNTPFHRINLLPKINQLSEVVVPKGKKSFKRSAKLKVFREEFLGKTIAGKYCKILNESDLVLTYNKKKKRLVATSDEPIKILNPFLGYELEYRIEECYIEFDWVTIKSNGVSGWKFSGTTYFKDLTTDSTSYAATRKMSYCCSQMEFFRNLSQHTLGEKNFSLLHGSNYCAPEQYFTVVPRENHYIVLVKNERLKSKADFYQSFILEYPGKPDSEVIFNGNVFRIDKFGNYSTLKSILFLGEISNKRIGDLLPLEYNVK